MSARVLMIQGTGSDVGKSLLVAGLCRAAKLRGIRVLPFKPQNMSNNAAVTADGGEIGRAQWLQARACGVAPSVHMNPVLLKPESDRTAQVVVQGKVAGRRHASDYFARQPTLLPSVLESFAALSSQAELILVEGAGSPAEVNLRAGDIANMGFATAVNAPVILVGDIDRGGVIASLVGTHALLPPEERGLVKGFIINKFRGDMRLFDEGMRIIEQRTGWHGFGIVPHLPQAALLPAEDAVVLQKPAAVQDHPIHIAVPMLSRIANFDDFDPLKAEPDVRLTMLPPGTPIPADADLVILPGTKSTIADLAFLRAQGWDIDLRAHYRRGGWVLGICGGYQMLGESLADPHGVDGTTGHVQGLGLLEVETIFTNEKSLLPWQGTHAASGAEVRGYEMHIGRSTGSAAAHPLFFSGAIGEGAQSGDGRVMGTYLHGIFAADAFRHAFLSGLRARQASGLNYEAQVENALNDIALALEEWLDMEALLAVAQAPLAV